MKYLNTYIYKTNKTHYELQTLLTFKMSYLRYTTDICFQNSRAYKEINKALKIDLSDNYGNYECDKYSISLDSNMAFIHFSQLDTSYIQYIMGTITKALHLYHLFVNYEIKDEETDEFIYISKN
jgi:hypothetical protein